MAGIAARQHGVVRYAALAAAGIDKSGIARRVAAGRLHRIYRGVYAVGHPGLSAEGRWLAAILASGEGAVLSHHSAAELWQLLDPRRGPVHVTVPTAAGRSHRAGIHLHRVPSLPSTATTRRCGIPVTTPARTIADLGRREPAWLVRRASRQAAFLGLDLEEQPGDNTRSELELRFLSLCRRHRLPKPEVNVRVGRFTVDFLWSERRLIVETDGYGSHRGRQAFEDDHARDNELVSLGYNVLRFTYARVMSSPSEVIALVRLKLGR